jgi:hypothetical protein
LDDIEHRLIRGKKVGELTHLQVKTLDPRIHAAVNCAALSCPPIHPKAFNAQNIDDLLQESMVAFLSSDAHFYQASENKMVLNSIVYWYYSDFDEHGQNLRGFSGAGDYLAQFIRPNAKDRDWKISHFKQKFNDKSKLSLKLSSAWSFDYDWRVNDARNQPRKLK